MTDKECEIFLENLLEFGRRYVATGAEAQRVEDSLRRICHAYKFENAEIYAVTSLIVVTIKSPEGKHYTQSIRVSGSGTDLGRLEELNAQSRYICENTPDVKQLAEEIQGYKKPKPKPIIKCIGYMLAAGSFSIFFGGSIIDGIVAAIIAIAIYLMDYNFDVRNVNGIVYTFIASFVSGALAIISVHFGFGNNADKVMIGDIMLLIPGLLLVNSIKEMLNRDVVTGLYRFVEAVFVAVAIAGGFALSVLIIGGALK